MVKPAFVDGNILALQVDGTDEYAFLIDEQKFKELVFKTYNDILEYFAEKEKILEPIPTKEVVSEDVPKENVPEEDDGVQAVLIVLGIFIVSTVIPMIAAAVLGYL